VSPLTLVILWWIINDLRNRCSHYWETYFSTHLQERNRKQLTYHQSPRWCAPATTRALVMRFLYTLPLLSFGRYSYVTLSTPTTCKVSNMTIFPNTCALICLMIIDILSFAAWLYLDSACTLFATRQPLGITDPPFATHVRQMILSRMSNAHSQVVSLQEICPPVPSDRILMCLLFKSREQYASLFLHNDCSQR